MKKIVLEIIFFFYFRKITTGGFVNQLIKKFWPNFYTSCYLEKLAAFSKSANAIIDTS